MSFIASMREDIRAVAERDPAAKNPVEILFCYPGLHAIWMHRVAHWFYRRRAVTLARIISHLNRHITGIEIHPGARIGRRLVIDHGMGIVIGETSEIGDDCLLYKGVVLGGVSLKKKKRHPTLGDHVVIGSNACVLGAITVGAGAKVGSGSVVVKSVPEGATVVGVPGRVMEEHARPGSELDFEHGNLPDPIADVVKIMLNMQRELEERLKRLESEHGIKSRTIMTGDSMPGKEGSGPGTPKG